MTSAMELLWSILVSLLGFARRVSSVLPQVPPAPISTYETDTSDAYDRPARPITRGWMIHGLVVNKIPLAAPGVVPLQRVVEQTACGGWAPRVPLAAARPGACATRLAAIWAPED